MRLLRTRRERGRSRDRGRPAPATHHNPVGDARRASEFDRWWDDYRLGKVRGMTDNEAQSSANRAHFRRTHAGVFGPGTRHAGGRHL